MSSPYSEYESSYISKSSPHDKQNEDKILIAAENWVIFIYQAKIADFFRNIMVTWCKNLANHSLSINVEKNPSSDDHRNHNYTCKIDLKSLQMWGRKGLKNFEIDDNRRVDVYWDFRQAKFSDNNPVPMSDYYVAIVYKDEMILLLGDSDQEAYKRTKRKPPSIEAALLCKKENVHGKELFCTRASFGDNQEHGIIIESSLSSPYDSEMWIRIDGISTIHVINLYWRFRGNETVIINNSLQIQIFWDVHDWLFCDDSDSTRGFFIFNLCDRNKDNCDISHACQAISGYCYILYAWRVE